MHPAYSIIVFTSLTGVGYGLAACLGLQLVDPASLTAKVGYVLAVMLISLGLVSSLGHLGHPERAWRALSQWRSSWLSREGVAAVAAFVPIGIVAISALLFGRGWLPLGAAAAAMCLVTVYCTSMIYASLKTVVQWNTVLTSLVFVAFAAAGGLTVTSAVAGLTGEGDRQLIGAALIAMVVAWLAKAAWWRHAATARSESTPESATGLGDLGAVRLLERPHVTENYLNREMGYRVARKHAERLRQIAVFAGALVPIATLGLGLVSPKAVPGSVLPTVAAVSHLVGVLVERWLFFAEARHTVILYYGEQVA